MQHSELFTALFNKNNRDNGNAMLLQEEAKNYPYFGAVDFFRLKEAGPGSAGYTSIAAKAALHFNNPIYCPSVTATNKKNQYSTGTGYQYA